LFQSSGGNFSAATLAALSVGQDAVAGAISRDARYVCGVSLGDDEATLWHVSSPGTVQGLGIPAGRSSSAAHGVSTGANPIVVGFAGIGSFVWESSSGIQAFGNPPGHGGPRLTGISADGQTFVGTASSALTSGDPFVYQNGTSTFLNESGGSLSSALAVSPNGNVVGGHIDNQGAIWRKGTNGQDSPPLLLSIDSNAVNRVFGITDTGFAVGATTGGGYIYDPRTGLTSLFDDWWHNETGSAVPVHVTSISDVYEVGGQIYFALSLTSGVALASTGAPLPPLPTSSLAVALLPSGPIELRWPTNRACTVESTPELTPPRVWTPRTNPAPTLANGQFLLALPATDAMSFFRLNCP
jgi:hypothetical protein